MKGYEEFLKEKIKMAHMNGEPCDSDEISQVLFPHQRDIVQWCVRGGQRAIFAAFGLGKTLMQAEIMRLLNKKTGCKTLIVCPLGVRQEFMRDGRMIGVNFEFIRRTEDFEASDGTFFLTNYESVRDGKLDPTLFNAVSLDEASCFPKGTLIDTPKGKVKIDLVRIGDIITNAGGVDYVRALHKNHVKRVAHINLGGDSILASADHRFFTTRGWVAAEKLQPGDSLVETTKAMLLLRGGDIPQDVGRGEEAFLQQILLSEMANVSKRDSPVNIRKKQEAQKKTDLRAMWQRIRNWIRYDLSEILQQKMCIVVAGDRSPSYTRSDKKTREENIGMVEGRKPGGSKTARENKKAQSNVKPSKQKENEKCSLWKNVFVSWRERQIDGASNIACRDFVVSKDGICDRNGSGKTKVRKSSELLQGGCSNTRKEGCDRGGWEDAQTSKMEVFRQEKNRSFKCSRVESVEILESRHPGLDKFREADGELYFYDLSATRHPSYSVNGFLVHNCLRSYGSKTYQEFLPLFEGVKYKFVATATPAPNRYKELIHYAAFLGVADSGQLLTRFFQRDSTQANNLTLYPHSEKEFWAFMHSWAIFLQKPSELGYSDDGYVLPDAEIKFHEVERTDEVAIEKDGQILMFPEASAGLKEAAKEKRISLDTRVQKMKELVEGYISQVPGGVMSPTGEIKDQIIIWCDLNDEQTAAEQVIKSLGLNCSSIYGSLTTEECEKRLEGWRNKDTYALIGKPVMLGSGVNLQQCNKAIFLGISYKFNDTIQAVHRIQRFQQTRTCEIHFIYCESEREVLQTLNRKWTEHNKLMANMSEIIKEHGLHNLGIVALLRNMGVKRRVEKGHMYEVALNDCVDEARMKEDNSVHLIISSIPFSNHYEYSPNYADMGHTEDNAHFWSQMDYLTPELLRILSPGRIAAIHVKDRVLFGNVTGAGIPTISPFHAEAIFHYIKHGFDYMGMITVVTDVVRENNQTYRLGWTENSKDGSKMGVGSPEYVLLFHKPQTDRTRGYADIPVQKDKREYTRAQWQIDAHAFWRSSGNRFLTAEELKGYGPEDIGKAFKEASLGHVYDYKAHVEVGEELDRKGKLPSTFMAIAPGSHDPMVWDDVNRMLTLNGEQTRRGLQSHICPLQFDIVDRLITRYSNKEELVYDPFGGLMTVPFRAIKLGRRGGASELCEGYFNDGIKYLALADSEMSIPSLFEMEELKAE